MSTQVPGPGQRPDRATQPGWSPYHSPTPYPTQPSQPLPAPGPRIVYGPVPRYGHASDPGRQPDPSQVGVRVRPARSGPLPWSAYPGPSATPPLGRPERDPAKVLGIVGLVLAFCCSWIGLTLSIAAVVRSRRAGYTNVPAILGIVVSLVVVIASVIFGGTVGEAVFTCLQRGPGEHQVGDRIFTCPTR